MTDDELKQTIADLAASVEAHTLSLDRLEDAMLADRERSNQMERVVLSLIASMTGSASRSGRASVSWRRRRPIPSAT